MIPVMMKLSGKKVLIVGGGAVAERKFRRLREEGCRVTIWSPMIVEALKSNSEGFEWWSSEYQRGKADDFDLVIAATDDPRINAMVSEEARGHRILFNSSTSAEDSDFFLMGEVNRGDMTIAVSTRGGFAGLTKRVREELEDTFAEDFGDYVRWMSKQRDEIIQRLEGKAKEEAIKKLLTITYQDFKEHTHD